jgi:hypothetical protein
MNNSISNNEDIAFGELFFFGPIIVFGGADYKKVINDFLNKGIIPLSIITDPNHELFIEVEKSKPEEHKNTTINCLILSYQHKSNFLA